METLEEQRLRAMEEMDHERILAQQAFEQDGSRESRTFGVGRCRKALGMLEASFF